MTFGPTKKRRELGNRGFRIRIPPDCRDEHISHAVANGLRIRETDVTTTTDAGLVGASDEDHLAYALEEQSVIVTHEPDYLRHDNAGTEHAGFVFCDRDKTDIGEIVRFLCLVHDTLEPADMIGEVEYL